MEPFVQKKKREKELNGAGEKVLLAFTASLLHCLFWARWGRDAEAVWVVLQQKTETAAGKNRNRENNQRSLSISPRVRDSAICVVRKGIQIKWLQVKHVIVIVSQCSPSPICLYSPYTANLLLHHIIITIIIIIISPLNPLPVVPFNDTTPTFLHIPIRMKKINTPFFFLSKRSPLDLTHFPHFETMTLTRNQTRSYLLTS